MAYTKYTVNLKNHKSHLNVRKTPNGKIIASLKHGATVQLNAQSSKKSTSSWKYVTYSGSKTGYVYSSYLKKVGGSSSSSSNKGKTMYINKKTKVYSDKNLKTTKKTLALNTAVYRLEVLTVNKKKVAKCKKQSIGTFYVLNKYLSPSKVKVPNSNSTKKPSKKPSKPSSGSSKGDYTEIKPTTPKNTMLHGWDWNSDSEIPYKLKDIMVSNGLYTRAQLKNNKFRRFFRIKPMDPYGAITNTKEYLFFTRPDLHILNPKKDFKTLNPELSKYSIFKEAMVRYPQVVRQLQYSCTKVEKPQPPGFSQLLTYCVDGTLDLSAVTAKTIDTPENIYGVSIDYRGDGRNSDFNYDFTLNFKDDRWLNLYYFFKLWEEYERLKKKGKVTPPNPKYTTQRVLHDQIGIYKFIVGEDGETIIYYAYLCGCMPLTVPRDAFSNLTETPTYSIDWKCFNVMDMRPEILSDFNKIAIVANSQSLNVNGGKKYTTNLSVDNLSNPWDSSMYEIYRHSLWSPFVYKYTDDTASTKYQYKLAWRPAWK